MGLVRSGLGGTLSIGVAGRRGSLGGRDVCIGWGFKVWTGIGGILEQARSKAMALCSMRLERKYEGFSQMASLSALH